MPGSSAGALKLLGSSVGALAIPGVAGMGSAALPETGRRLLDTRVCSRREGVGNRRRGRQRERKGRWDGHQ